MEKVCVCKSFSDEKRKEFKNLVHEALKALNKKNLSMIIHGASFPSIKEQDTGFGTYNSEGGKKFIEFVGNLGFNGIQLGPDGKTKAVDSSPYMATMFSNNPLFIDLQALTTSKYGKILSVKTFDSIVENNPAGKNRTAYGYAYDEYNKALHEAFETYKKKQPKDLKKKFDKFVKDNSFWLEKDALYEALSAKHKNDYHPMWNHELDKELFCPDGDFSQKEVKARIAQIKKDFGDEMKFYEFVQLLFHLQKEDTKDFTLKLGIKTIADAQVAFSDRDFWANQAYFMKDYMLGCPPDCFSQNGQAWGFPVMNPDAMFNPDGTLGEGGKVLKERFRKMFEENPGGVRIDHIIGLIDPYVYRKNNLPRPDKGASRLYSSPEHKKLGKYAIPKEENLNPELGSECEGRVINLNDEQIEKYAEILQKIVIDAAAEEGIEKESIICEDLGTITNPVYEVMNKLGLSGLRVTQFVDANNEEHTYRVKNTEPHHWVMTGSHDNTPTLCWIDELFDKNEVYQHALNLACDLKPKYADGFKHELMEDKRKFLTAKYAELFASPAENVQIFFADFLGMRDRYNMPGTSSEANWSLRVPQNYECLYYCQIAAGEALNLPEVLVMAIESKDEAFIAKHRGLIEKLREYSKLFSKTS